MILYLSVIMMYYDWYVSEKIMLISYGVFFFYKILIFDDFIL